MKLTKKNLEDLRQGATPLQVEVLDYCLSRWDDYDNKNAIISEVLTYGCISGIVGNLIYYDDTTHFYNKHKEEINGLLYGILDEVGETSLEKLFQGWDTDDPLALNAINQNLLAWFGFEETLRRLSWEFDEGAQND